MKYILVITVLFFMQNRIYGQHNHNADSIKYITAYNFIVNDSINQGKSLNVSDSLVMLNLGFFHGELRQTNEDEITLFTRLYKMCQNVDMSMSLSFLSNKKHNGKLKSIVFFSPIINDSIICADLLDVKNHMTEFSYERVAMFNTSYIYLFIFNEIGEIKSVYRKEMIYN